MHSCSNYAAAVGTVGAIPAVAAALKERGAQRLRLNEQLAALDAARTRARQPFSAARLRKDLRHRMDDWRALLCRQTPVARQILTKLIEGRLVFTAHPDEMIYRFKGRATLGYLLEGLIDVGGGREPDDHRDKRPSFGVTIGMASPICASWNQIAPWLRQIDALRAA